jgi:hypothetical protein
MFRHAIIEENVAAFKEQALPNVATDVNSFASRFWVYVIEPVMRALFYLFFITVNIVNGALALVFSWTRSLVVRPISTLLLTFIVLFGLVAILNTTTRERVSRSYQSAGNHKGELHHPPILRSSTKPYAHPVLFPLSNDEREHLPQ